jgi:DNA-binding MarR family transcriptional regulator
LWFAVTTSRGLPDDRLAIGQILVRLLYHFRTELFSRAEEDGLFSDLRFPHLQVWGNVGIEGIRLTDLAGKAQLSLAACSELVDDLQQLGYLERWPDPSDGRAKLIVPTTRGRELLEAAGQAVADIEQRWSEQLPPGAFDTACRTLNSLLAALEVEHDGKRAADARSQ